jgi:hypothetical protein
MNPDTADRARLEALLATEATQGLSERESAELDELLARFPDEDPDGFERAAAAVHRALSSPEEEMPAALAERLHLAAVAFAPAQAVPKAPRPRPAWLTWSGWVVAAGLAGVLVYTQWPRPQRVEPTLPEQFADLKKRAPEFVGEKKSVTGTIVWSDKEQVGYMEVKGLPPIDPAAGTYQLWIVDSDRPKDSPPVDGGVFKVNPDGTALIRIKPPIQVKNAAAFAVTRENDPAGVVVSGVKPENYELVLTKKG